MINGNSLASSLTGDGTGLTMLYFGSYTVDFGNLNSPSGNRLEDIGERSILNLFSVGTTNGFTGGEGWRACAPKAINASSRRSRPLRMRWRLWPFC